MSSVSFHLQLFQASYCCKRRSQRTVRRKRLVARIQEKQKLGFLDVKDDGNRAGDQDQDEDCSSHTKGNTDESSTINIKLPETKICGGAHLDSESTKTRLRPMIAVFLIAALFVNLADTVKQPAGREDMFGFFDDEESDQNKGGAANDRFARRSGHRRTSSDTTGASAQEHESQPVRGTGAKDISMERERKEERQHQEDQEVPGARLEDGVPSANLAVGDTSVLVADRARSSTTAAATLQVMSGKNIRKSGADADPYARRADGKKFNFIRDVGDVLQVKLVEYEQSCTAHFPTSSGDDESGRHQGGFLKRGMARLLNIFKGQKFTPPLSAEEALSVGLAKFCKFVVRAFVYSLPFYFRETFEQRSKSPKYVPPLVVEEESSDPTHPQEKTRRVKALLDTTTKPKLESDSGRDWSYLGLETLKWFKHLGQWNWFEHQWYYKGPSALTDFADFKFREGVQVWQNLYSQETPPRGSANDNKMDRGAYFATAYLEDKNEYNNGKVPLDGRVRFGTQSFRKLIDFWGATPNSYPLSDKEAESVKPKRSAKGAGAGGIDEVGLVRGVLTTTTTIREDLSAILQKILYDALHALACAVDEEEWATCTEKIIYNPAETYQRNQVEDFWPAIGKRMKGEGPEPYKGPYTLLRITAIGVHHVVEWQSDTRDEYPTEIKCTHTTISSAN